MYADYGGFGEDYYEGNSVSSPHPAGYANYRRSHLPFKLYAGKLRDELVNQGIDPTGSKVLVVGCSCGYTVEYLIDDWDVDAYGLDISSWAVAEADTRTAYGSRVANGDVLVGQDVKGATPGGKPDVVFTECVLSCLTDSEAQTACENVRKEARDAAVHRVWTEGRVNADWYNTKTLAQWQSLCDPDGVDHWFTDGEFQSRSGT